MVYQNLFPFFFFPSPYSFIIYVLRQTFYFILAVSTMTFLRHANDANPASQPRSEVLTLNNLPKSRHSPDTSPAKIK